MKKLYILVILLLFMVGCDSNYALENIEAATVPETVIETVTVTETVIVEVENTEKIDELEAELQSYKELIGNLNELLECVYYGYASNSNWILDGFTAFSLAYQGKYYLITAGHCVEPDEYGKMANFKFKANFSNEWIYPELIHYDRVFDYAIFQSDKINSGLEVGKETIGKFVLGNYDVGINVCRSLVSAGEPGLSGSPVVNTRGGVVGILITEGSGWTSIKPVLEYIGNVK